jgi:hypothetical protein
MNQQNAALGTQWWVNLFAHEVIWHGCCDKGDPILAQTTGEIDDRVGFDSTALFYVTPAHVNTINKALGFK